MASDSEIEMSQKMNERVMRRSRNAIETTSVCLNLGEEIPTPTPPKGA